MANERLIKKYANRRLYDASQSRHVTLDDVREFVIQGEKLRVVEDKTGEDITRLILLQVIAEQEQFGQPILSTTLLESIIRFYGNGMQEFMARYLEKSVETFTRQQETMQAQMTKLMANAPMTTMAEMARQNLEMWARMQESMASAFSAKRPAEPRAPEQPPAEATPKAPTGTDP
ncbi:MAG: polyhydroxyalkanoate synthesis repressor PhaR [Steroidobacteraceae bacterium]|jgi:polyhydroxyalkanoate synthesis repressor PhaR|nr:polyhydroxyalkanoate synthesis repressor PhaR [Steroidobacteraceae bacterium]